MNLRDVFSCREHQTKPNDYTCGDAYRGHHEAFNKDIGKNVAALRTKSHANSKLSRTAAHRECENTGNSDNGNEQCDGRESTEDDRIQFVGSEDLGANVSEGAGL